MSGTKKMVTIITPTYNLVENDRVEVFIKCLESVHRQSYKNYQHLIMDGASGDGTADILRKYADAGWIQYVSSPDCGIYDAMNHGVELSQGEYIVFLNSDDCYINDDALMYSVTRLEETDADFTYSRARYVDRLGNAHPEMLQTNPDMRKILFYMPFCHQTMVARKDLFTGKKFNVHHKSISDYEWLLSVILSGARGEFIDDVTVEFLLGGMSSRLSNQIMIKREKIEAYYNVFRLVHKNISMEECERIEYDQEIPDDLWSAVRAAIRVDAQQRMNMFQTKDLRHKLRDYQKIIEKNNLILSVFSKYLMLAQTGIKLKDWMCQKGYTNCAVYGMRALGERVLYELEMEGFEVRYAIDQNASAIQCSVPVFLPTAELPDTDVIIVTPVYYLDDIKTVLQQKMKCTIVGLDEILDSY